MWQNPADQTFESSSPLNIKDVGKERGKKQREETECEKTSSSSGGGGGEGVDSGFLRDS